MDSEHEQFLRALAPIDFDGVPIYVLQSSDGLQSDFLSAGLRGFTGPFVDIAFQERLSECGKWRGRGPAIVLDDVSLLNDVNQSRADPSIAAKQFRQLVHGVLLHELAHVLDKPIDLTEPTSLEAELATVAVTKWCKAPPKPKTAVAPFVGHTGTWIRNAVHLAYRAQQMGVTVPLTTIVNSVFYELSWPWEYRAALGDEPARMANASFAEIRETKPPNNFIDLWRSDARKWFMEIESPCERSIQYLCTAMQEFD